MNIFILDYTPEACARAQCEQHLRSKMLAEDAQLLATAFPKSALADPDCPRSATGSIRGQSHPNHPCARWIRQSRANMLWLIEHARFTEDERMVRGYNPHKSIQFVNWCADNLHLSTVPEGDLTPFAIAIGEEKNCRKHPDFAAADTVEKYRLYYKCDKPFATWKRNKPEWY